MKNKILNLLYEINDLRKEENSSKVLPGGVYYLNENDILCTERKHGESRYPYEMDGMTVWAHSTGYINACESTLTYFRTASLKEETSIDFFGGIRINESEYYPISILGPSRQLFEDSCIKRYTVFSKRCAYYITDTKDIVFAVRCFVTSKKQISFKICAINKGKEKLPIYLTSFMEPLLRFSDNENFWGILTRYAKRFDNGNYMISTTQDVENFATVSVKAQSKCESTVAKSEFLGISGRNITNAEVLKTAHFENTVYSVNTSDLPIVSDIMKTDLEEYTELEYLISFTHDRSEAEKAAEESINSEEIERDILKQEKTESKKLSQMNIEFGNFNYGNINNHVFNRFLKNVQKQVDFCALGKNYAGDMIGIRDVFQQLESALMWNWEEARDKILTALGFIMTDGRSPRQFSIPPKKGIVPKFDMRQFIDQGLWIISAIYSYLCFTGDYSILDEECTYFDIVDEKKGIYKYSDKTGSVLEHVINIMNYLISNIDPDTKCLKILYGDWNDAVNGLGKSQKGHEFGNGVSVMASLQMNDALHKLSGILKQVNKCTEHLCEYETVLTELAEGLEKYALQSDSDGKRHIIHGWGDEMSYRVGSLCDSDGACRYSINSNSFWCLSDMLLRDKTVKSDILAAYAVLDSKYGLKTFYPHFPKDMEGVGRITTLTPGTYENGCTYVHATLFAVAALFKMGEPEKAWEQIKKVIPITHENVSLTPFVMPNSYCYNEEYNIDGESMGDWFTGSGTVLMRDIVKYALGIQPNLDGLAVAFPGYIPADSAKISIKIKGANITLAYKNKKAGKREYFVNSQKQTTVKDELSADDCIFIKNANLTGDILIEVSD